MSESVFIEVWGLGCLIDRNKGPFYMSLSLLRHRGTCPSTESLLHQDIVHRRYSILVSVEVLLRFQTFFVMYHNFSLIFPSFPRSVDYQNVFRTVTVVKWGRSSSRGFLSLESVEICNVGTVKGCCLLLLIFMIG